MPAHTPGDWRVELGHTSLLVVSKLEDGTEITVADVLDDCHPDTAQQEANARLIAASPAMIDELRETAAWLDERADVVLKLLADPAGWGRGQAVTDKRQAVRDEAARMRGRAALLRQTVILKATQGA